MDIYLSEAQKWGFTCGAVLDPRGGLGWEHDERRVFLACSCLGADRLYIMLVLYELEY